VRQKVVVVPTSLSPGYVEMSWALFFCHSKISPPLKPAAITRWRRNYLFSVEEKGIRACPERSAELLLEFYRRIRILGKLNFYYIEN